jgi:HK97 gp10 family phage protein
MIDMSLDLSAVTQQMDKIAHAAEDAIRPAAQAGAQVYYNEVKLRAKRGNEVRHLKGGRTRPAGLLASAIYQVYSKDNSDAQHATYHISWNAKKAPHGHLVERGTSRAPASPFVRPAFDAMHARAEAAVTDELAKRLKAAL